MCYLCPILYKNMQDFTSASLVLENGSVFKGKSFGYEQATHGEVVFSTAMVGYPESLTDPSFSGQILVITYPLVGNYGVPESPLDALGLSTYFESEHIKVKALIVTDYSFDYSHWNAAKSLGQWLKEEKIPAIYGVDTRELTKILREQGTQAGKLLFEGQADPGFVDMDAVNRVAEVSCTAPVTYAAAPDAQHSHLPHKKVVLLDCGAKNSVIRRLVHHNVEVVRVPWNYDFTGLQYDGLFISNGPGNPNLAGEAVAHIRKAMEAGKPIMGICLGSLLLALAAGAQVKKLKYGHHSLNQPVRLVGSHKCFITEQAHGYAVDTASLPQGWEAWFENMNDGTNEGFRHQSLPFCAVQFHPETASGPSDTGFLYDQFVELL